MMEIHAQLRMCWSSRGLPPPPCTFHCFVRKVKKNAHRRYTSCAGSQSKSFTWFLCVHSSAVSVAGGWTWCWGRIWGYLPGWIWSLKVLWLKALSGVGRYLVLWGKVLAAAGSKSFRGIYCRFWHATTWSSSTKRCDRHLNCVALACRCKLSLLSDVGPLRPSRRTRKNRSRQQSAASAC